MKRCRLMLALVPFLIASCTVTARDNAPLEPVTTGIDPGAWAIIPAGSYLKGQHEHETMVDYDYEMMVTDVTNSQYADFLNQALADDTLSLTADVLEGYYPGDTFLGHKHEEEIPAGDWLVVPLNEAGLRLHFDGQLFSPMEGYEQHPMVQVTWFGARTYCDYFGWRLPNEVEWEKAARGSDGRAYPWGNEIRRSNANFYSSHDIFEKIVGGLGDTTPVGFYSGKTYQGYETVDSPSPYGLYDMAGNVWQWTGDIYEGQHYRYLRGGAKDNYAYNLRVWTRNSAGPEHYGTNIGFRCVRDRK